MKRTAAVLLTAILLFSCFSAAFGVFASDAPETVELSGTYGQTEAREMLALVNDFRTGENAWYLAQDNETRVTCEGLNTLVYDYDLERIAMQRAAEIALSFSHTRPNGESCFSLFSGNTYYAIGENIAAGYPTAESVFIGWREDDEDYEWQGHRRNMLNSSFTAIGIGHFIYNGWHFWVQEFRNPVIDTVQTPPNDAPTTVTVESLPEYVPHTHSYVTEITRATPTQDGKIVNTCACGDTETSIIEKASNIKLSQTEFTYNGKVQKSTLTVKDSAENEIPADSYTVKWSDTGSKAAGKYTVTITLKGNYSGKKTLSYKIVPRKVTGLKAAAVTKTSIKLSWTKKAEAKYYQVYRSTDGKKWTKVATVDTNAATVKDLKTGKTYYFKVRALDASQKVPGAFSSVLKTGTQTAAPKITKLTSAKTKTATVTWGKVTGAKSYTVYKSADGKKWTAVKSGVTKLTYTLTGLTSGKKVYVKVAAVNAYGKKSAASAVKTVKVK